jgi:type I restriction enzyme S subunit
VFVSEEKADSLRANLAAPMDVVFTQRGANHYRQVAVVPEEPRRAYLISQSQMKVTLDPRKADPLFIYYVFRAPEQQEYLQRNAIQTGVPHTNLAILRKTPLWVPDVAEQRRIAHILGTLDDKIDLNRRMSETLEAMARALFKSWFVDFDPVRAKLEGRWRRGESLPGLPAQFYDLFPDELVETEFGELPQDWEPATLADFSLLNSEAWSMSTRPSDIHYVDLSNVKWGRIETVTTYPETEAPSRARRVLRQQDSIIGTVRPGNGSYAFVCQDGLTGSTAFAVLRPLRDEFAEFIYLAATSAEAIADFSQLADGGAYPAISSEIVASRRAVRPSDTVAARFSSLAGPVLGMLARCQCEALTLDALRNSLLEPLLHNHFSLDSARDTS